MSFIQLLGPMDDKKFFLTLQTAWSSCTPFTKNTSLIFQLGMHPFSSLNLIVYRMLTDCIFHFNYS